MNNTENTHIAKVSITTNKHAEMVLDWWKLAGEYSIQIVASYLKKEVDSDAFANLASILRRLLIELIPKARDIADNSLLELINKHSKIITSPDLILQKPELLFEVEQFIRDLLEITGYTNYEQFVEK